MQDLKLGKKVIVHCHMGLHRSGLLVYILLRRHGLSPFATVQALRSTRELTYLEMLRYDKNGNLFGAAETIFKEVFCNITKPSCTKPYDVDANISFFLAL